MKDLKNLTIKKAGELLRNKQVSAVELTENYFKNIYFPVTLKRVPPGDFAR